MVNKTPTFFTHHLQAALNSLNILCQKPIASFMTLIVIAIALALPTLFWVFTDHLNQLAVDWQRGGHVSIYVKPALTQAEQKAVLLKVKEIQGVAQATLITPADGLKELTKEDGMQDVLRYLPGNPLPAVIEVIPSFAIDTPAKLEGLANALRTLPQVEQAKLDTEWITKLHAIAGFFAKTAKCLLLLLAMAVVLIIATTLSLIINNRHEEIQVLKLVGASDPYILRPFLYSGACYGLVGCIIAIFLVNIIILSLGLTLNQLIAAYDMHYAVVGLSIKQIVLLLSFSTLIGWLGALLSVKRQLTSIEPYN